MKAEPGTSQIGRAHRIRDDCRDGQTAARGSRCSEPVLEQARLSAFSSMRSQGRSTAEYSDITMDRHRRGRDRNILFEHEESLHCRESMFGFDERRDYAANLVTGQQNVQKISAIGVDHLKVPTRGRANRTFVKLPDCQASIR